MKYLTIVDFIKNELFRGSIKPGGRLPSIREICESFKCTKSTAIRAYYELKEQGIIYAVPGSGYYIIDNHKLINHENEVIDFSGTSLDPSSLPYSEFQPCINQAINKYKEGLFSYADPQGISPLIKAVRKHLQNHQIFASDDRILITTGSQQALNILSKMSFPNNRINVAVEQPTYQGILECLKLNDIKPVGIPRDFNGLDFDRLEKSFRSDNIKFFYTIPRFSNPLGLSYSNNDKKKILALADKYNVFIVEDDYLGNLDCDSKSTPVFSFDKTDRVIYLKTFSKVLLPGLRTAIAIMPKILVDAFKECKYWSDLNSPLISQGALEIYMNSGMFDLHVTKIRDLYSKKLQCLKGLSESNCSSSIRWYIPSNSGFYAGIKIMNASTAKAVIDSLLKMKVLLSDIEPNYLKEFYSDKILRVSIARADMNLIKMGIPLIVKEIENSTIRFK